MMTQTAKNMVTPAKRERLEMRVDSDIKTLAERTAAALGTTTTDLIVSLIRENAPKLLEQTNHVKMTNRQFDEFATLTNRETHISSRLQKAASRVVAKSS